MQSIKINLNKTTFTLNNDAYHQLNNYVSALKNSFKSEPDILFDIEARIAELLTIQLAATQAEIVEANHINLNSINKSKLIGWLSALHI
jgi:hypothetical protein